jgi:hypothetical protein
MNPLALLDCRRRTSERCIGPNSHINRSNRWTPIFVTRPPCPGEVMYPATPVIAKFLCVVIDGSTAKTNASSEIDNRQLRPQRSLAEPEPTRHGSEWRDFCPAYSARGKLSAWYPKRAGSKVAGETVRDPKSVPRGGLGCIKVPIRDD